jgi:hypothetical protein
MSKDRAGRDEMDAIEALAAIEQWAEAYPEDVFPAQDLKSANEVLAEHGISMSAMYGTWGRHITQGIARYLPIIRKSLIPEEKE